MTRSDKAFWLGEFCLGSATVVIIASSFTNSKLMGWLFCWLFFGIGLALTGPISRYIKRRERNEA